MQPQLVYTVVRDKDSEEFFEGTANGVLLVRQCVNGHYLPPTQGQGPAIRCHTCLSDELSWVPSSGEATLVSWVVPHARTGEATSVAAIVELAEGPWMNALIDAEPDDPRLQVGLPLTVTFLPTEGEVLPAFRPR